MGRTGLTEYLRYAYGPLEGRMAYYTAYSTDCKLLGGKMVESCNGTWWTHVTCQILLYSATLVELTNHDFLCWVWKITISSLSTSALAALKI